MVTLSAHTERLINDLCAAERRVSDTQGIAREILAELKYAAALRRELDAAMQRITELALRAGAKGKE